jgi:hypothetical protein
MAHAISLFFEQGQISFNDCHRELFGLKVFGVSWALGNPFGELMQDPQVRVNGSFVELSETGLVIAQNPLLISYALLCAMMPRDRSIACP